MLTDTPHSNSTPLQYPLNFAHPLFTYHLLIRQSCNQLNFKIVLDGGCYNGGNKRSKSQIPSSDSLGLRMFKKNQEEIHDQLLYLPAICPFFFYEMEGIGATLNNDPYKMFALNQPLGRFSLVEECSGYTIFL